MAEKLNIKYTADSVQGNSLSSTVTGRNSGWVEYCNQRGQLFYADAISEDFYKKCHQQAIDNIVTHLTQESAKNLGFIHHLSSILINDDFVFPMFGVVPSHSDQLEITTGLARLTASMMNGCTAQQLKTVVFVPHGQSDKILQLKNAVPLSSTDQFEKIYNLTDIDYEISMSDSLSGDMSEFRFDRSVLKHSIYDKQDQTLPHTRIGSDILNFWGGNHFGKSLKNEKILINIRCTPEVEKLIQPSKIFNWNVLHEKAHEWEWSYGKILGAYRKTEAVPAGYDIPQIHLWLYNVTEPVHLVLLFPWMSGKYTCCYSKNKKALFFDTSNDITSMQIIGDWVK